MDRRSPARSKPNLKLEVLLFSLGWAGGIVPLAQGELDYLWRSPPDVGFI